MPVDMQTYEDIVRISAKGLNVFVNPLNSCPHIQQAEGSLFKSPRFGV